MKAALSIEDESQIRSVVQAIAARDKQFISCVPKDSVFSESVFWEWVDYIQFSANDVQDDIFCDVHVMKPSTKNFDFEFINVGLRWTPDRGSRVRLLFVRPKAGGELRLNSISDVQS